MTAVDGVLLLVLAALVLLAVVLVIDGGAKCEACGWTANQCAEAWFYSKRPCCSKCSHEVVDINL